jgi:hypothetical protein
MPKFKVGDCIRYTARDDSHFDFIWKVIEIKKGEYILKIIKTINANSITINGKISKYSFDIVDENAICRPYNDLAHKVERCLNLK